MASDRRLRVMARFLDFAFAWIKAIREMAKAVAAEHPKRAITMHQAADRVLSAAGSLAQYVAGPKPARRRDPRHKQETAKLADGTSVSEQYQRCGSRSPQLNVDEQVYSSFARRMETKVRQMIKRDRLYRFGSVREEKSEAKQIQTVEKPGGDNNRQRTLSDAPERRKYPANARFVSSFDRLFTDQYRAPGAKSPP